MPTTPPPCAQLGYGFGASSAPSSSGNRESFPDVVLMEICSQPARE